MKQSKIALPSIMLGAMLLVSGCGGSSSSDSSGSGNGPVTATISGKIAGLPASTTLLLVDNGSDTISANANGNFTFDTTIASGSAYNVTLFTQPTGAVCAVTNGAGKINQDTEGVTNVSVSCQRAAVALVNYNVGVTVSGLKTGNSMTFLNNGKDTLSVSANGLSVFPQAYAMESPPPGQAPGSYSVDVLTNPAGQTCALTNPIGVATTNFANVVVACQ